MAADRNVISTMYFALAPATSSTPIIIAINTDAVPRSGCTITRIVGYTDQQQALDEPGVGQRVGAILGKERRKGQQRRELGELGGLDLQRARGRSSACAPPLIAPTRITSTSSMTVSP